MKRLLIVFVVLMTVFSFVGGASITKVVEYSDFMEPWLPIGPKWVILSVNEVVVTYMYDSEWNNFPEMDATKTIHQFCQVGDVTLSGVTTKQMWIDGDGDVWFLCSIPNADFEKSFEPIATAVTERIKEVEASEAAKAANAKMKEAFAELLKSSSTENP